MYTRSREPWTKEAVWRKLSAFCNLECLKDQLGREGENEKDIIFAIKTAKNFLLRDDEELPTSMIEIYYGIFWTLSAMVMIRQTNITLEDLSKASSYGHGLTLTYEDYPKSPEDWTVYIQRGGLMNFLLKHAPFECDIDAVSLPEGVGKKKVRAKPADYQRYGFTFDTLMSRIPEMEWHYELLRKKVAPVAHVRPNGRPSLTISKLATKEWVEESFPTISIVGLDENESKNQPKNTYNIKPKEGINPEDAGLFYSSLLTDVNLIKKPDLPVNSFLLWHFMFSYGWSIIARYTPDFLQQIDSGEMSEWKPFLSEYFWLARIIMPTACLNSLTKSDWRFAPPALWGG